MEVVEIKNKMLFTFLILAIVILLAPIVDVVQAGKGQEKLLFKLEISRINEPVPERTIICSPKWETPPVFGGDANVVTALIDYSSSAMTVTVGVLPINPPDVILEVGTLKGTVFWNGPIPGSRVLEKDEFTLDFSGLFGETAKIEISRVATRDIAAGLETGTFVGHGLGLLEGVKVSGKQTAYSGDLMATNLELTGTIMGWPN